MQTELTQPGPLLDAHGKLTYTVKHDAFGTANVGVIARDNGGTAGVNTFNSIGRRSQQRINRRIAGL